MSFIRFDAIRNEVTNDQEQQALRRYVDRSDERDGMNQELQAKNPFEVDSPERAAFRKATINPRDGYSIERIIGQDNLFPTSYLEAGVKAAKSVCRIEVRDRIGRVLGYGTGFLVSPSLLLTNNHILKNEVTAEHCLAQFNYEHDLNLRERQMKSFRLSPKRFFMTNTKLDFTLVALEELSEDKTNLSDFGFLPLFPPSGKGLVGEFVSVIQHPSGAPKALAIRDSKIIDVFDDYIHYSADTLEGSSGSPVFNDEWTVVALHHAGVPDPKDETNYIANEGTRVSSIVQFVQSEQPKLSKDKKKLIDELLKTQASEEPAGEEILVKELSLEWYEGSTGHDPAFLGNSFEVPFPAFRKDLENDITPVESGENILHYTHFSAVMSKSRRLAFYTVVDIDGNQLRDIKRGNDRWYYDPRIPRDLQCGEELYKNNDIDRGHLVRRRDPVWGDSAEEANEDTFHFTNCSPQHKDFNQKTWLDLEDYLLNNAENGKYKVTVFTGPIFRNDDVTYRGVQIPAEFWKIAAMVKDDGSRSATAYLQSQKNLVDDLELANNEYKTYQVPLIKIEELTGLDFGDLRKYDPVSHLEATVSYVIQAAEDIRL
ncbi:DNA/RNA non-specific endonuclease [Metabacillus arenae]|uniref:DNA/RNA non-specific endonuclease n=1 Tax=Metabacillus arenae TaxID=2771434 RepID=A0A926NR23_9BACI|nr:DNA/RNA non-specific endonuclease [Metabacillus arenae]MBD1382356.1 DNA/RNA non-specific endonuclease [Metabacillus arenae]